MRTIAAGAVLAVLACAAPASARTVEIGGATLSSAESTCPDSPCQAVSRTTGYQARTPRSRRTYVIPADGRIVAWTIGLGNPNTNQIDFFNSRFGEASAGLTILRRTKSKKKSKRFNARVARQSPVQPLAPYFGQRVQFPLIESIPVKKGWVVGLTVPTWAPALTQLLDDGSAWRASRGENQCGRTGRHSEQTNIGQVAKYWCLYKARLTYSATLITNPKPNPQAQG